MSIGDDFLARNAFEERIEKTAIKASKAIERPPDEMKSRARETVTEFVQELEQLYKLMVITEQDTEGLVVETHPAQLEKKHKEALTRICDLLYNTYVRMGKKDEAKEWKKRTEAIAQPDSSE